MTARSPVLRRLSLRLRFALVATLVIGSLVPPYVPAAETSSGADDEDLIEESQYLFVEDGFLMKTAAVSNQATRLAFGGVLLHRVKAGETLQVIAEKYKLKTETVRWANNLDIATPLVPDQELIILPVDGVLHTVHRGQTLSRIAQLYDVAADRIASQNDVKGSFVVAGDQLVIPGARPVLDVPGGGSGVSLRFAERLGDRDISLPITAKPIAKPTAKITKPSGPLAAAAITSGVLQMPCENCFLTQGFNPGHYALDLQTRGGGPIFAAEAGTVVRADNGYNGGYGNVIEVDHGNGLVTLYAHNRELYVKAGDRVERGQQIAFMGNTGRVHGPTGIHLHFEVRSNGVKKNPKLYLD